MEFYDGILFLTTNRIGAFDVKLYYRPFTSEERQRIWQTFIDKLMKDRGSSMRVSIDAKDFIKGKQMKELKWNGREIRNGAYFGYNLSGSSPPLAIINIVLFIFTIELLWLNS